MQCICSADRIYISSAFLFGCVAQQVTILEVKNKQQARLLHQVRGVRNSLMQVLQESKETEVDKRGFTASAMTTGRESEIVKLKAGMKAALAHIKDLETFIDEM